MKPSRKTTTFVLTLIILAAQATGCGKDEKDFEDLDGEFGSVPGSFLLRLAPSYRDQVDSLAARVDSLVPGLTAQLTTRFAGDDSTFLTQTGETKLSDLLQIKLPGSESEFINQKLFTELVELDGDDGNWFDVVDTNKFTGVPKPKDSDDAGQTFGMRKFYDPDGGSGPDPQRNQQYYLEMIRWEEAVSETGFDALLTDAAPVVVAVLDTGVLATHEDLADVMWQNSSGAVGYDATTGKALAKAEATDVNGHGTHVAGIIGATGRNKKGVHGVGYVERPAGSSLNTQSIVEIMGIKVLNDNGAGTSDQIGSGIKWAVEQHRKQKKGARANQKLVLNMSLGGPFETLGYKFPLKEGQPYFEDDLFNFAVANDDTLIIVAAGNETCGIGGPCDLFGDSYKATYYYPCSYENVLCVAATTHEDRLAGFSNRKSSVGIAAPGYEILSTLPDETKKAYGYYSGTSQATPVTSGAASVVWSLYPDFSAAEIKAILQKTAAQVGDITSEINSGDGRLDLTAALAFAADLKNKNESPLSSDPAAGLVKAEANPTPKNAPAGGDAYAPSPNQKKKSTSDKGKGSAGGNCAVGAPLGSASTFWFLLTLGFPLIISWRRG